VAGTSAGHARSACYIGWLFPPRDAKRRTFAGKIIGTVVVPE
jgi:hypothetical protein